MKYAEHFAPRATPQNEPIPGTVPNSAGGYAFAVDDWTRLNRFLILGSEKGSYYAGERALTRENAHAVVRAIQAHGPLAVAQIAGISQSGRAPKNDPAIFALALASAYGDQTTKHLAHRALRQVCRTGEHLFQFAEAVDLLRGWGRGLRHGVADWYLDGPVDQLAYQAIKYRQRNGWTHRDLLRSAHPETTEQARRDLFDWICRGTAGNDLPGLVRAFMAASEPNSVGTVVKLIEDYNLPREAVPPELLNDPKIWRALLKRMPMTAMVRSLGKLSALGVLAPLDPDGTAPVLNALGDAFRIHAARLHPLALLLAQRQYAKGSGEKHSEDHVPLTWTPVPQIVDALNHAFYLAFQGIEPTGKRIMLALDVSGSMTSGGIAGTSLTPREGSAAMALVTAAKESAYYIVGFTAARGGSYWSGEAALTPLPITPAMRLDQAVKAVSGLPFGRTDCALPMVHALENGLKVDAFVVYTDSETWAGRIHPVEALRLYRDKTGIPAKLVVVGMVSNGFSIADPNDAGMMDVVGFDTAAPAIIADFIRG